MSKWNSVLLSVTTEADRVDAEYFDANHLNLISKAIQSGFVRLDTLCAPCGGKSVESYDEDGSVDVVRSGDLVFPLIYPGCGATFLQTEASSKLFWLKKGDVLISSIGMGSIGKVSLVMDPTNLVTVPEVTVVRDSAVPSEFLYYYLRSPLGQVFLKREITGATGQQHLLPDKAGRMLVPSFPKNLKYQLGELCEEIWALEKNLARLRERGPKLLADQIPSCAKTRPF